MTVDKDLNKLIDEIWCVGYNCGANNFDDDNTEFIRDMNIELKSLIKEVCEEVIGEDASMGRDALTYDEKEHINQWLNEQRTKLNNILGSEK